MIEHLLPAALGIGTDILEGKDAWPDIPFARMHNPPISGLVILVTILLGSTLPLLMFGRWIPEGRTPRCRTCGHDLTGIDSSNRCPECGEELPEGCIRTSLGPRALVRRRLIHRAGRWWALACVVLISGIVLLHPGRLSITPDLWLGTVDLRIARLVPERMAWPYYYEVRARGIEGTLSNRTLGIVANSILDDSRETGRHRTWLGGMVGGDIVGAGWSAGVLDLDDVLEAGPFQPTLAEGSFNVVRAMNGMLQARVALWGRAERTRTWARPIPGELWVEIRTISAQIGEVPASGETRRIMTWPEDSVLGVRLDLSAEDEAMFAAGPRDGVVETETRLTHQQGDTPPRVISSRRDTFDFSTTIASTGVPTWIRDIATCSALERDLARHSRIEIDPFLREWVEIGMSQFSDLELGLPTIEIDSNRSDFMLTETVPWEAARFKMRKSRSTKSRATFTRGESGTKGPGNEEPDATLFARWELPTGFIEDDFDVEHGGTVRIRITTSLPESTAWIEFLEKRHRDIHGDFWAHHPMESTDRVLNCEIEIDIPVVRISLDDAIENPRRYPSGDRSSRTTDQPVDGR